MSLVMMDISMKSINPTPPFAKIFCRSVSSAFLDKASFFSPFLVSRLVHTHIFIDFFQKKFVFWNEIYSRFVSSVFLLRFQCHTLYRYFFVFLYDFFVFLHENLPRFVSSAFLRMSAFFIHLFSVPPCTDTHPTEAEL